MSFNPEILYMEDFTKKSHDELSIKLDEMNKSYNPGILPDQRLDLIVSTIEEIKQKLISYRFHSEDEEVQYFKNILPATLSLYIYYSDRIEWDRIRLQGSAEKRSRFTDRINAQSEQFRTDFKEFYEYCRDGKTGLDSFYFLRASPINRELNYSLRSIIDRNSPPVFCERMARLMAYSRLEQELRLNTSENNQEQQNDSDKPKLIWTLPKRDLVEIIYAFKGAGAFNDGKAELVLIQHSFEKMFGVSLGNISRSFQELMSRKKGHTSFLDQLKEALTSKL
jgi:hypothetical protein